MEAFYGILIPFLGTSLGAACVLFMKNSLSDMVQRSLTGFAAGVMVAASVWSLLIPAIEQSAFLGRTVDRSSAAVSFKLCGWGHALCGCGRADSRNVAGHTLQHRYAVFCGWVQRYDGFGCRIGIIIRFISKARRKHRFSGLFFRYVLPPKDAKVHPALQSCTVHSAPDTVPFWKAAAAAPICAGPHGASLRCPPCRKAPSRTNPHR